MTGTGGFRERGATLVVSMVMLVVIMLLAVSAIRTSTVSLRIAGNVQAREEAAAAAQQAIEMALADPANFYSPAARTVAVAVRGGDSAPYQVTVNAPQCIRQQPVDGYSVEFAESAPRDTYWEIEASVSDPVTGASVTVRQGVRVRLNASATCP